jgi:small subunit ribosomal protein S6
MPLYEHVFLARQDVSGQQAEAMMQEFKDVIEQGGGSVEKTEYWGVRPISYRIRKNRKAHYALMNINAPHEAVAELERQMRLNSDVLRFMTIRVDELEEGPSAMMRRSDRDERDGRGRGGDRDRGDRRPPRDRERASNSDDNKPSEEK